MSGSAFVIETHSLVKRFPRAQGWRDLARLLPRWRDRQGITALDGVDLAVRRGEVFGLVGPNGAGKTTLIKILCALILPTAGRAQVNGYDLGQEQAIKTSVGLVAGDERSFYWRLSGRDNLIFFGRLHGLGRGRAAERAEELLAQVGLAEVADRRFQTYSAGLRQRLAIARGMLHAPPILFMDEPTLSLDPNATRRIHGLIRDELVDRRGTTVFLATHRLDEATALCDRVAILDRGRVRAAGTLAELQGLLHDGQRYEIVVRGLAEPGWTLQGLPPEWGIRVHAGTDTRLTFTALNHSDALQQVLERVWRAGGTIQAVHSQPVSLEEVFALVTGADEDGPDG
jgi:ABC-2 type transport system ATP-binding protein